MNPFVRWAVAVAAAVACAPAESAVGAARQAGSVSGYKAAVITSVDGPRELTLRTRAGGRMQVRLASVDAPRVGECGALETTTALRSLAKRFGGRVWVQVALNGRARAKGGDGRLLASVQYRPRSPDKDPRYGSSLAQRLLDLGWAQYGVAAGSPAMEGAAAAALGDASIDSIAGRAERRGVWSVCGGWFHRPAGPQPAAVPASWSIDQHGLTTAIGPLRLPTTLAPDAVLTIARVRDAFGALEMTEDPTGCSGGNPDAQVGVIAAGDTRATPCDELPVFGLYSYGPKPVSADRGVRTGMPMRALQGLFDSVTPARVGRLRAGEYLRLGPGGYVPWAWQTMARFDDAGKVAGFFTSVVSSPERPGD